MARVKFILKEPKSKDQTPIYLHYRLNGSKLKYSTGQRINPKLWNPEKQRTKEVRTSNQFQTINFLLDQLDSETHNTYRKLLLEGNTPTPELLRIRLNEIIKKENSPSKDLAMFRINLIGQEARTGNQNNPCGASLNSYDLG